jgi:hypothetical protein
MSGYSDIYVNVGDAWKRLKGGWVNVRGRWRCIWDEDAAAGMGIPTNPDTTAYIVWPNISGTKGWTNPRLVQQTNQIVPVVSGDDGSCGLINTEYTNTSVVTQFGTSTSINKARSWIRFPNYQVQNSAPIDSAIMSFLQYSGAAPSKVNIYANDIGDAVAPTNRAEALALTLTTATVQWQPTDNDGVVQSTPNIAAIISEVVSRPDYAKGNAIMLILDSVSTGYFSNFVTAYSVNALGNPLYPAAAVPYLTTTFWG